MIPPSDSWFIGHCGATNSAIRACVRTVKLAVQIGLERDSRGRVLRNADHRGGAGPAGAGEAARMEGQCSYLNADLR